MVADLLAAWGVRCNSERIEGCLGLTHTFLTSNQDATQKELKGFGRQEGRVIYDKRCNSERIEGLVAVNDCRAPGL